MPKSKSQLQEQRIAKLLGGRVNSGSGNGLLNKNDVRTRALSVEAKYTDANSYSLKGADLEKGERHAIIDGRDFVFWITMRGRDWVVLSAEDYLALTENDF